MLLSFILTLFACLLFKVSCFVSVNNRPIIGVLSQEFSQNEIPLGNSFIVTTYVKFLEASGARVVPIFIYQPEEYYQDIMSKINGVLFPGGNDIISKDGYSRSFQIIYDIAVEMNDKGDYFPLWGTCLGFELFNYVVAKKIWMTACSANDVPMKIGLNKGSEDSRMFSNIPHKLKTQMETQNVSIHFHHWCMTPQNFSISGLDKYFKVLAVNQDIKNITFVSVIEAFKYPFYGITFHPEKVLFEWSSQVIPIPHTAEAVEVSQYFGNFFVNEARKNFHQFPSKAEEDDALIYNYNPIIYGPDPSFQMYIF